MISSPVKLTLLTQAKTLYTLYSHCASHFHKRVEEKHKDLMEGLKSEGTPKGRSAAEFSFANSGNLGENTPASPNTSRDSTNSKKRAGSADSSGCNFSLQCEVCKTQVILLCCFSLLILVSRLLIPAEPYSDILPS